MGHNSRPLPTAFGYRRPTASSDALSTAVTLLATILLWASVAADMQQRQQHAVRLLAAAEAPQQVPQLGPHNRHWELIDPALLERSALPSPPFIGALTGYQPQHGFSNGTGSGCQQPPPAVTAAKTGSADATSPQETAGGSTCAPRPPLAMDPYAYALYNPQFGLPLPVPIAGGSLKDRSRWRDSLLAAVPAALDHYERVGKHWHEPVFCTRIPVLLRLNPDGGLCNMVTSTVTALVLAVALGGDVVLPDVHTRPSFERPNLWTLAPFSTLFNQQAIVGALAELGVHAVVPPALTTPRAGNNVPFSSATVLTWYAPYSPRERKPPKRKGHRGEMDNYDLPTLLHNMTQGIVRAATQKQAERAKQGHAVACNNPPTVIMRIYALALLRTAGLPLAAHLLKSMPFSDVVEQRAQWVADNIAARGYKEWNGMHLRLEDDNAKMTINRFGGLNSTLQMYIELCKRMGGWAADTPVYLASGLFTYTEGIRMFRQAVEILRQAGVGAVFLHKELFDADESTSSTGPTVGSTDRRLPSLDSEQAAAVDLLLLQRAKRFVGITGTSFTWHVVQRRLLEGRSPRHQAVAHYCKTCSQGNGIDANKLAKSYLTSCAVMQCAEDF